LRAASCFHEAVESRTGRWHTFSAHPTGILYREPDAYSTAEEWCQLNKMSSGDDPASDRLAMRRNVHLFQSMTSELTAAIEDAVRIHTKDPTLYYRMILRGIQFLSSSFSWERNAREVARTLVRGCE
jgi:hypothetical protein